MPVCIKDVLIQGSPGNFYTALKQLATFPCRLEQLSQWQMILTTVEYAFR